MSENERAAFCDARGAGNLVRVVDHNRRDARFFDEVLAGRALPDGDESGACRWQPSEEGERSWTSSPP